MIYKFHRLKDNELKRRILMQKLSKTPLPTCVQCSFGSFCLDGEAKISTVQYELKKKETLNISNEKFRNLYIVQKGALKSYEIDLNGNEIIHELFFKNEIYGYEAIYKGSYLFSCAALSDTVLCKVKYEDFLKLIQEHPRFLSYSFNLMSRQLNTASYLKYLNAQQKVAAFILDVFNRLLPDKKEGEKLLLPCSYQQIGYYLRLATETVSRILSQFKQDGHIAIHHKQVTLLNANALEAISKGF